MPKITEGRYEGGFIISEAEGARSRDVVTLASNGSTAITYQPGTVLAKLTANSKYVGYDNVGTDGSEVAAAILFGAVTVPATGDLPATVINLDAEVNTAELFWDASLTGSALTTAIAAAKVDLAAAGIKFR